MPAEERTTDALLRTLDFDFFELLDSVTIARSRKHIEKYYNTSAIGKFPERLPPVSLRLRLTDLNDAINYNDIYNLLMSLNLTIYTPSNYIMPSRMAKYIDMTHHKGTSLTQQGREEGIRRLMGINLLKRLESSVYSFRLTIDRIKMLIDSTIETIDRYQSGNRKIIILPLFLTRRIIFMRMSASLPKRNLVWKRLKSPVLWTARQPSQNFVPTLNTVLTCFSPVSKGKSALMPGSKDELDILIATDCISEGQNLQDCDYLINYDIH